MSARAIRNGRAVVAGQEFRHLRHALRMTPGEAVLLRDENGTEFQGTILEMSPHSALVSVTDSVRLPDPACALHLAPGLLKGKLMDFVIEKATELGAARIRPYVSTRSVARLAPTRLSERLARWQRIAQSASKQSGNALPRLDAPVPLEQLLASIGNEQGVAVLLYEMERGYSLKMLADSRPAVSTLTLIIGPEGGFEPREVEEARQRGVHVVGLGSPVLRAETACVAGLAQCRLLWGSEPGPSLSDPRFLP